MIGKSEILNFVFMVADKQIDLIIINLSTSVWQMEISFERYVKGAVGGTACSRRALRARLHWC